MIGVVDYGLGNVAAFENIYRQLGIPAKSVKSVSELESVSKIILPGVGAFDLAMHRLQKSGMFEVLNSLVLDKKVPILGVCVGMQIMACESEEGKLPGLGWINAKVKRLDETKFSQKIHLPHMGWNGVAIKKNCLLFDGITDPKYYFLHSYFIEPNDSRQIVGTTDYGMPFASVIVAENIFATQFHPEKSHMWGVRLLQNFSGIF